MRCAPALWRKDREMMRLLIRAVIFFVSSAIGLLVAALVLDDFEVTPSGFLLVVVLFALIQSIISPFLMKVAAKNATAFLGGIGLLATFIALLVATVVGDSLTINGVSTWIAATVIVWLATAVATFLLPFAVARTAVDRRRDAHRR